MLDRFLGLHRRFRLFVSGVGVDRPDLGVRLTVLRVDAKFKYDDHNPVEHRERVINNLQERGRGLGTGAAAQQQRRLAAIGDWRNRKPS